jgi:crooked neck
LAIEQARLDMPELLWKAFIDFEIEQQEYDRARKLYGKLLKKTQHVKVKKTFSQSFLIREILFDRFGLV